MKEVLYLGKSKINLVFKSVFTGKLRTDILTIIKDNSQIPPEIVEKRNEIVEKVIKENKDKIKSGELNLNDIENNVLVQLVSDGEISLKDVLNADDEKYLKTIFKLAQVIIDEETYLHLKDEDKRQEIKKYLTEDLDEEDVYEFWLNQDLEMLESKIEFFRSKIKTTI